MNDTEKIKIIGKIIRDTVENLAKAKPEDCLALIRAHGFVRLSQYDWWGEGKCPECGGPPTHPSGLCIDCHQAKLEAEDP